MNKSQAAVSTSGQVISATFCDSRIDAIVEALSEWFGDDTKEKIVVVVLSALRKIGASSPRDLDLLVGASESEINSIKEAFTSSCDSTLPLVLMKKVVNILTEKKVAPVAPVAEENTSVVSAIENLVKTSRPVASLSDAELLDIYNEESSDAVISELTKRSHGRPFVIFKDANAGVVDIASTLRMLKEARRREMPVFYTLENVAKKLYRAGDFPSLVYHVCPIHGDVLLLGGFCDKCGHNWEGVSHETRQFVRVLHERGVLPKDKFSLRQLINIALQEGLNGMSADFPKEFAEYEELKVEGKLPSLVTRTAAESAVKVADPFGGNKRY